MKRRLGPAWLEPDGAGGHRRRRGRPKPGYFDEHTAIVAKDRLVREVELELAERAAAAERAANAPPTFRAVAHAYLDWLERVRGAKPSTLRDHRYLLAEPGTVHRRTSKTHRGLIIGALGDRPATEITTRNINRLLADVAKTGVSPRTVNRHRQLVCAIFSFGCLEATFALPHNPALAADRRPEPERARLDFYSPEDIEALARALADGRHRDPSRAAVSTDEAAARADEDRQDAELVRVAAYTGLRRGELVALRWRDLDFERSKLVVCRAVSGGIETSSTKSRRAREVPLADQAAGALARLSQRGDFTSSDDYVFCNRLGRRLDGSALRRRGASDRGVRCKDAGADLRPALDVRLERAGRRRVRLRAGARDGHVGADDRAPLRGAARRRRRGDSQPSRRVRGRAGAGQGRALRGDRLRAGYFPGLPLAIASVR
jgi:integrase